MMILGTSVVIYRMFLFIAGGAKSSRYLPNGDQCYPVSCDPCPAHGFHLKGEMWPGALMIKLADPHTPKKLWLVLVVLG